MDTITDFNPSEDKIELAKAVFTQLQTDNLDDYLHYDRENGELSYGTDGNLIAFVQLPTGMTIEQIQFAVI